MNKKKWIPLSIILLLILVFFIHKCLQLREERIFNSLKDEFSLQYIEPLKRQLLPFEIDDLSFEFIVKENVKYDHMNHFIVEVTLYTDDIDQYYTTTISRSTDLLSIMKAMNLNHASVSLKEKRFDSLDIYITTIISKEHIYRYYLDETDELVYIDEHLIYIGSINKTEPSNEKPSHGDHKTNDKFDFEFEYDVDHYLNAEDFYYDYYDDFADFEEAEDYFNEHSK